MKQFLTLLLGLFINFLYAQSSDSTVLNIHLSSKSSFSSAAIQSCFSGGILNIQPIKSNKTTLKIASPAQEAFFILILSSEDKSNPSLSQEIIISPKDRFITLNWNTDNSELTFNNSLENAIWQNYLLAQQSFYREIQSLEQFINQYPDKKETLITEAQKLLKNKKEANELLKDKFLKDNKGSIMALYIQGASTIKWGIPKEQFWSNVNIKEEKLMYTPLYAQLIPQYAQYFPQEKDSINPNKSLEKLSDDLIQKFSISENTQKYIIGYLAHTFQQLNNEKMLQYLDNKWGQPSPPCELPNMDKAVLNKRSKAIENIKNGDIMPDIRFTFDGKEYGLKDLNSDKKIVVFYSSACPTCKKQLAELDIWRYNGHGDIQILGISADANEKEYKKFSENFNNIIHFNDLKGTSSPILKDFNILNTPTFLILGKNRELLLRTNQVKDITKHFE